MALPTDTTPALSLQAQALSLRLPDGERQVPYRWLRYECACEACGSSLPGLKRLHLHEVPAGVRPAAASWDAAAGLSVTWAPDGHVSHYASDWLAAALPDGRARVRCRAPRLWDASQPFAELSYARLVDGGAGLYQALATLRDRGAVLVRGVPAEPGETERLAGLFGPLHETSYGRVFNLESRPGVFVAGTTSRAQTPHTDEPFRYTPPGFLFFHSIRAGAESGGTSLLVDGFAVAEELRRDAPAAFALLSRVPVQFHRWHGGEDSFHTEAPVITLSFDGGLAGIRYNDRATAPLDLPADLIEPMLDALALFVSRLCEPRFQSRVLLQPGDLLIFDNHRVLHGRTAFDPTKAHRLLRSCHVDRDAVHSRLRVLAETWAPDEAGWPLPQGAGL